MYKNVIYHNLLKLLKKINVLNKIFINHLHVLLFRLTIT